MGSMISNVLTASNADAARLVESFLSCSAAADLVSTRMKKLDSPLFKKIPSLSVHVVDEGENLEESIWGRIVVSKHDLNTPKGKSELILQIMQQTGGHSVDVIQEYVKKGLNADQFAHRMIKAVYLNDKVHDQVLANCAEIWDIKKNELEADNRLNSPEKNDLEFRIWDSEFLGIADVHRALWIDKLQKDYCNIYPEDLKSCELKHKDLLLKSLDEVRPSNYPDNVIKRVCDKFLYAPKKIQEHELYKKVAETYCPALLPTVTMNITESNKQEL
jgi:hypothetical protein